MLVTLTIDPDACIGSGECVALDPDAVHLDEHGTACLVTAQLDDRRAQALCDACPTGAISIVRA